MSTNPIRAPARHLSSTAAELYRNQAAVISARADNFETQSFRLGKVASNIDRGEPRVQEAHIQSEELLEVAVEFITAVAAFVTESGLSLLEAAGSLAVWWWYPRDY